MKAQFTSRPARMKNVLLPQEKFNRAIKRGRSVLAFLLMFTISYASVAQSLIWSDTFQAGMPATTSQCNNWTNFLDDLGQSQYLAVKISGTHDNAGITLNDRAAATELARLLNTRTEGVVEADGHTWRVHLGCNNTSCVQTGVELVVDGEGCQCESRYVIRPHNGNSLLSWGGVNTNTCDGAVSQTMNLEFVSGAAITASGATKLCEGETVTLTASSQNCVPNSYLWSNGATTESITVSESGNFFVEIFGADNCYGISRITKVEVNPVPVVDAGDDVTLTCDVTSVTLNASGGIPNGPNTNTNVARLCLFDAPGGADCVFGRPGRDLCSDGSVYLSNNEYAKYVTARNPAEINYLLYYTSCTSVTTFTFKVNDQVIGTYDDDLSNCVCIKASGDRYPKKITIPASDFHEYWNPSEPNKISISISASGGFNALVAGFVAEVVSHEDSYRWSPSAGLNNPAFKNPVASPLVSTTYTVHYTTAKGCVATDEVIVNVDCGNDLPTVVCKPVVLEADRTCHGSAEAIAFDDGSTAEDGGSLTYSVSPVGPYDFGITEVTLTVKDANGLTNSCITTVTVTNEDPKILSVNTSASAVSVNASVSLNVSFIDNNVTRATIDWNDNSPAHSVANPENIFSVAHAYSNPGLYSVTVTLADACGATDSYTYDYIVVYDVNAGFVTGGGWYNSPQGAYLSKPTASGKATFEFVIKYKKRGSAPEGNTEFNFNTGDLKFKSIDYDWLMVDGHTAVFKGSGNVNGKSGYGILISIVDEDAIKSSKKSKKADRIRVKIFNPSGDVIYDTQIGSADPAEALTAIGGGSIQIHDGKARQLMGSSENTFAINSKEASTEVYPNPFSQTVTVRYYSSSKENLHMQLMDITGKAIYDRSHTYRDDGSYSLDMNDQGKAGLYILKINQGRATEFIKLIRK